MKTKNDDIVASNTIFLWIALSVGIFLLLPYSAMKFNWRVPDPGSQVTNGVNWTLSDFIVMGILLFVASSAFVLIARAVPRKNRLLVGVLVAILTLWIWAELAVGVFTNIGS